MPSTRVAVHAPGAPKPNGNYSHCIRDGNTLHICGFMGDDPETGKIVEGGVEAQTERAILNIRAVLEAAGSSLDKVVRRRIFIIDMNQFRLVDEIWGRYFEEPFPVSVRSSDTRVSTCELGRGRSLTKHVDLRGRHCSRKGRRHCRAGSRCPSMREEQIAAKTTMSTDVASKHKQLQSLPLCCWSIYIPGLNKCKT